MDFQWEWIGHFGSLRERDCFVAWMQGQIANGMAEEIEAPADEPAGERWFRHIPTGSVWRLLSDENPNGPGFWPAHENDKAA
jgi:hypothetical protein